jgi:hypothetical protein
LANATNASTALVLRQALVRSWSSLARDEIIELRVRLLKLIVEARLLQAVRLQLIETGLCSRIVCDRSQFLPASLLVKRSWLEMPERQNDIFDIVSELIANDDQQFTYRRIAFDLLNALLCNFGIRCVDV